MHLWKRFTLEATYMYIPSTSLFASGVGRSLFLPIPIPACANGSSSSSDHLDPDREIGKVTSVVDSCVKVLLRSESGMNDKGRGKSTSDAGTLDSLNVVVTYEKSSISKKVLTSRIMAIETS